MSNDLTQFRDQRIVVLTTFKRDGSPVGTPVSIAVSGPHAYVRTWDTAWKARRLARNPEVEVAPSTVRGRATGPAVRARARLLEGEEAAAARRALGAKHPVLHRVLVPMVHRVKRVRTLHYELTPER